MPTGLLDPNANIGFYSTLTAVKADSSELPVQLLWQVITTTIFPPMEGYKWGFKDPVLATEHKPDVVVFEIRRTGVVRRESSDCIERQIFVVECKAPYLDTPGEWDMTRRTQLRDYVEHLQGNKQGTYCAVAIGTKVHFFAYDPATLFTPLSPSALDLSKPEDRPIIEDQFQFIKENGWDFARPRQARW